MKVSGPNSSPFEVASDDEGSFVDWELSSNSNNFPFFFELIAATWLVSKRWTRLRPNHPVFLLQRKQLSPLSLYSHPQVNYLSPSWATLYVQSKNCSVHLPLVAYVQNSAFTLSVPTEAHASKLVSQGILVKTKHLAFYRGERLGSMVRLFGLPFSSTYDAVHTALSKQLGVVNLLQLRTYKGTSTYTGRELR